MNSIQVLQVIVSLLILIGTLYLAFVKSYSQEKGKNLATKEDIEEITQKIEQVKSDINILTHKKVSILSEKQKTLLQLHSALTAWIDNILNANFNFGDEQENFYVEKIKEKIEGFYIDFLKAESAIYLLFVKDKEFIESICNIKIASLRMKGDLFIALVGHDQLIKFTELLRKDEIDIPFGKTKEDELSENYEKRKLLIENYNKKRIKDYEMLLEQLYPLTEVIYEKIHNLN